MTFTAHDQGELRQLISGACDNGLSAEEFERLQQWILDDPDALACYVRYLDLHASLAWEISARDYRVAVLPAERFSWRELLATSRRYFHRPLPTALSVATLFMAAILLGMAFVIPPQHEPSRDASPSPVPNPVVARITSVQEPVWADEQRGPPAAGDLKAGERLELAEGLVEVTYLEGTRVTLEGPVEFVTDNYGSGILERGRLVGFVPRRAAGFSILTPVARIVDLGTEFGLAVAEDGGTDVTVYQGAVSLGSRLPGEFPVEVRSGQSYRVTAAGDLLAGVSAPEFVRSIRPASSRPDPIEPAGYEYLGDHSDPRKAVHIPGAGYFDDRRTLLSDHRLGSRNLNDGRWVGWFDSESLRGGDSGLPQPAVQFDLGRSTPLQAVQVSYLVNHRPGIHAPDRAVVSLSSDGISFSEAVEFNDFRNDWAARLAEEFHGLPRIAHLELGGRRARFVRIEFYNSGQWTFLSEVLFLPPAGTERQPRPD